MNENPWINIDYLHPPSIYKENGEFFMYETKDRNGSIRNLGWIPHLKKFGHGFLYSPTHWREII